MQGKTVWHLLMLSAPDWPVILVAFVFGIAAATAQVSCASWTLSVYQKPACLSLKDEASCSDMKHTWCPNLTTALCSQNRHGNNSHAIFLRLPRNHFHLPQCTSQSCSTLLVTKLSCLPSRRSYHITLGWSLTTRALNLTGKLVLNEMALTL